MFGMVPELTDEQKKEAQREDERQQQHQADIQPSDEDALRLAEGVGLKSTEEESRPSAEESSPQSNALESKSGSTTSTTTKKKDEKKDSKNTEKKKKGLPSIGEFIGGSILGGQVILFAAHGLYGGISEMILGRDIASRLDSLFLAEGTSERKLLDVLQLIGRGYLTVAAFLGGTIGLTTMAIVVGGTGFGYFWLSSNNGDANRMFRGFLAKKRLDILLLFAAGILPGWFYPELWDTLINPLLWSGFPFWDALQPATYTLIAAILSLWKLADQQQKRKKVEDAKTGEGVLKRGLRNTKVGEVEINGEKAGDVSALDVYETLTQTDAGRQKIWENQEEVPAMKLARFATGVGYGLGLQFAWCAFSATVIPTLKLVFFGQSSWLTNYLWYGLRAAHDLSKE